jgi:membrane-bound metal-dependent hydrolase YbcI (DUF457 family)
MTPLVPWIFSQSLAGMIGAKLLHILIDITMAIEMTTTFGDEQHTGLMISA